MCAPLFVALTLPLLLLLLLLVLPLLRPLLPLLLLLCRSHRATQQSRCSERRKFQSGEKLIGIISDAASTGVSLQVQR